MREIHTQRDAKHASDHELATEYERTTEEGDYVKRNLVVEEALSRGISTNQLEEIQ